MQSWLSLLPRWKFSFFSSFGELDILLPLHQLNIRFNQGAGCDHVSSFVVFMLFVWFRGSLGFFEMAALDIKREFTNQC